ncbi:uncharacterized protein JN550_011575 [Neoarthrinium moseri]|uniref:uncharacterized protein n=1 Tax=Neoarthrinium moseri TaxID=1658444 RepID=UPI001FDE40C2|nr:uncharacterized protein JN550_011575 [Neoarthrinium moseri]KAI1860309.1 hypothetical protein JN550_011575 [Neoarthrinium moseri]
MAKDNPNGATRAKSALEQLPTEITQHIFGYLDLRGVDNLALTSKQLYATLKHGERTILCQWIESHIEPELISLAMVYLVAKRAAWKPTIGEHIQGTWRELCSHISKFGKQYLAKEALQLTQVPAEVDRTLAVRMVSVHRAILAHSRYYFSFVTLFDPSPTELFRFHRIMYIMEIIRILIPVVPPRGEPDPIVLFLGTEINKDQEPLVDAFDEHSLFWDRERVDKETPYLAGTQRFVTADEVASGADGIMLDFRLHDSCSELRTYNDPSAWLDQWL